MDEDQLGRCCLVPLRVTQPGALGLLWALFSSFCIGKVPNSALSCPSLVKLHRTSSAWQRLGSPLLYLLFECVQVIFFAELALCCAEVEPAGTA